MKRTLSLVVTILFFSISSIAQNYVVDTTTKTFRDSNRRNRNVRTRIYYPQTNSDDAQKFPVIVLGHGFVMGSDAYQNFYANLVPKGYIIAFVDTEGSVFANHDAYSRDMAFISEAMQEENTNTGSPLFGKIANSTALMGHSLGGGAATVAASLTEVETLVVFAPALLRFDTLTPATQVSESSLVFSGGADGVTPPNENHIPIFDNLNSSCKYFINIEGGAHCYYANSNWACDFGERSASRNISVTRSEQQAIVFELVNAWLDYSLKGIASAKNQYDNILANLFGVTSQNSCNARKSSNTSSSIAINVFPNPSADFIKVETNQNVKISKLEIYDQLGSLILTTNEDSANISAFKPGTYFAKMYTENSIHTKALIFK